MCTHRAYMCVERTVSVIYINGEKKVTNHPILQYEWTLFHYWFYNVYVLLQYSFHIIRTVILQDNY